MNSLITRDDLGADSNGVVSRGDFSNRHLANVSGKGIEYRDSTFAYSIIECSYFHKAKFINCNFTGARIHESVFRSAIFENCDFRRRAKIT